VSPRVCDVVCEAVRTVFGVLPERIQAERALPFRLAYTTPETLGADRLAAAAAAWLQFGPAGDGNARAVVALDAGTAVTTEVITAQGVYLGGAIAPGPDLLRRALAQGTAQLPEVEWPPRPYPIGHSTREALSAGLSVLFLDGVRGLLTRTSELLGTAPFVVATGGWAVWLAHHLPEINQVAPHLVLDGIRLLVGGADFSDARRPHD
jgi:type III pantothenate kinase